MSKLTLSVDERIISQAKRYAARHGTSVSNLVSRFLDSLGRESEQDFFDHLHATLEQQGYRPPNADDEELRRRHVERKYR